MSASKKDNIVKQLLTGKDGETHDIARWSWMISLFAVVVGGAYELFREHASVLREFAESVGIIAGAHGAAVFLKKDAEPDPIKAPQSKSTAKKHLPNDDISK
jgi:hypothetical protein